MKWWKKMKNEWRKWRWNESNNEIMIIMKMMTMTMKEEMRRSQWWMK